MQFIATKYFSCLKSRLDDHLMMDRLEVTAQHKHSDEVNTLCE